MDSQQLRQQQAPLKQQYKDQPETALVTLTAEGQLGEGVVCKVQTGKGEIAAGLHEKTGGDGSWACSGDMLLEALAGCAGVTLRAVATALDIPVEGGTVRAEGDLDFRGTLGVDRETPVGFQAIRLHFDLQSSATEEQQQTLMKLTKRYCVIYQSLVNPPEMSATVETHDNP